MKQTKMYSTFQYHRALGSIELNFYATFYSTAAHITIFVFHLNFTHKKRKSTQQFQCKHEILKIRFEFRVEICFVP